MDDSVQAPNGVEIFTMLLLRQGSYYLLLERAASKRIAPGFWTGLGGRVEPDELADLTASALRELNEEIGINADQLDNLRLRRALLLARPAQSFTLLVYFTGELKASDVQSLACTEGTLHWIQPRLLASLRLIDNAALVIPLLIEDTERDPAGREPVRLGAAAYAANGSLQRIVWA